tara:strand:+ start:402 stop:674 length:273 start_codon:yes stop_codon:yes gene_type:complete
MKVLSAIKWLEENKDLFPNGCSLNKVMEAYAEYYHKSTLKNVELMGQCGSEWDDKYGLLDVDFETFCKMMDYPKNEHDEYLRGENNPGCL